MKRLLCFFILGTMLLGACIAQQAEDLSQESIVIRDALDHQVTLPSAPQRIVAIGKGLFMIVDAAYIFPEAPARMVGMGDAGQGSSNFIALIDPDYESKAVLADAGAEQIVRALVL